MANGGQSNGADRTEFRRQDVFVIWNGEVKSDELELTRKIQLFDGSIIPVPGTLTLYREK